MLVERGEGAVIVVAKVAFECVAVPRSCSSGVFDFLGSADATSSNETGRICDEVVSVVCANDAVHDGAVDA